MLGGEAILVINGVESKIFLKDEITNVTLHDLAGGKYNVTVIYPGDNKYANSTASTSFFVLKESCNLTVDVVQNDNLTGIVNIKTNPKKLYWTYWSLCKQCILSSKIS